MFQPRFSLASALLLLPFGACALSACFLSQEDQLLNIPPQRNRPPRIMEEQPLDPSDRVIHVDTDCPILHFSFRAEDPDVEETLTVRWYVDYHDPTSTAFIDPEQILSTSGNPIRNDPGTLDVNLTSNSLGIPAQFLQLPGTHVVEAVLFDGRLGAHRQPLPIDPALDGGIPNLSYAVSYAWVVEVSRTCPQ